MCIILFVPESLLNIMNYVALGGTKLLPELGTVTFFNMFCHCAQNKTPATLTRTMAAGKQLIHLCSHT